MCQICYDIRSNRLTAAEARRNFAEQVMGKELHDEEQEHAAVVQELIGYKELIERASSR